MSGLKFSVFIEPDINNEITAVCIEPSETTKKLTSRYPLMLREEKVKEAIVFHYNKAHNLDASIPPWVVKHKGNTHYVNHLDCDSSVGFKFSTKETPDNPHTKGSIKFKGKLELHNENNLLIAKIS